MAGDLIIEEGDLEVRLDRTNVRDDSLEPFTVATGGVFLKSAIGGV